MTNGIANIKPILVIPFLSQGASARTPVEIFNGAGVATGGVASIQVSSATGFLPGVPVFQSPFDPAGCGATSPLCHLTNFNVQVSGQNAIYNLQKYSFEEFNDQLYGCNAVNGGLTDGCTSGLIDRLGFDMEYCYYYVNLERMLPDERRVPKSIQLNLLFCQQHFLSKRNDIILL